MMFIYKAKSFSKGVKRTRIEVLLPYSSPLIHERAKLHLMAIVSQCDRRFMAIWRHWQHVWAEYPTKILR